MEISIPKDFIIGAAASAWQTEGWKGKKEGQDSFIDSWYKNERFVWHEGYGPAVATNFMAVSYTHLTLPTIYSV